jgi:hypothetical protein
MSRKDCKTLCSNKLYNKFSYDFVQCYLKNKSIKSNSQKKVLVMVKDASRRSQGPPSYKAVEKDVLYCIPLDKDSKIQFAYFTPSSNDYNYMYLLSRQMSNSNQYAGEHFTMGIRNNDFDLHYTSYVQGGLSPCHLFYKFNDTYSGNHVIQEVCNRENGKKNCASTNDNLLHRCDFFKQIMEVMHNTNVCTFEMEIAKNVANNWQIGNDFRRRGAVGGFGKKANTKKGGNIASDISNATIETLTHDEIVKSFGMNMNNVEEIEYHLLEQGVGLITFFFAEEDADSKAIRHNPYVYPFDFNSKMFVSLDELFAVINGLPRKNTGIHVDALTSIDIQIFKALQLLKEDELCALVQSKINTSLVTFPMTCSTNYAMLPSAANQISAVSVSSGGKKVKKNNKKQVEKGK